MEPVSFAALIHPGLIFTDLDGSDRPTVLRAVAERIVGTGAVADAADLYRKLEERERLGTTGIGDGIAIPHCKVEGLDEVVLSVGRTSAGVDFEAVDGEPVHVLFVLLSPADAPAKHLQSLAAISRWLKTDSHIERMLAETDPEAVLQILRDEEAPAQSEAAAVAAEELEA